MPPTVSLPRTLMARAVYAWILFVLLYFWLHNSLVHQWRQPPLIYPEADNLYWLLHALYLPQAIMRSPVLSWVFDLSLLSSVTAFLIWPRRTFFCAVSIICLWLYEIMYSSANGHHYHHIGLLLLPLPFLAVREERFYFSWSIVRYWVLFLFVCAGVYKLYYGGFFHPNNMSLVLRQHVVDDAGWRSRLGFWLIDHEALAQKLYQATALMQIACALGFLNRRFDPLILAIFLLFNLANIFLLNIPFWDNSLTVVPFLPWGRGYEWVRKAYGLNTGLSCYAKSL